MLVVVCWRCPIAVLGAGTQEIHTTLYDGYSRGLVPAAVVRVMFELFEEPLLVVVFFFWFCAAVPCCKITPLFRPTQSRFRVKTPFNPRIDLNNHIAK